MKTALLLCASHNDLYLIRSPRKLGYRILVTGNTPGQPGERLADRYIQADYSNKGLIATFRLHSADGGEQLQFEEITWSFKKMS